MTERRPNPKALTDAERIASVDFKVRQSLIADNLRGVGMKHLAKDYDIPERTVRVIIRDAQLPMPNGADLWTRPELWPRYGIKGPCTPRMVPAT